MQNWCCIGYLTSTQTNITHNEHLASIGVDYLECRKITQHIHLDYG